MCESANSGREPGVHLSMPVAHRGWRCGTAADARPLAVKNAVGWLLPYSGGRSNCASLRRMSDPPIRICKGCGAQMRYLDTLPAVDGKPALQVFRCYGCNNVEAV
jgi:hypothetical protein